MIDEKRLLDELTKCKDLGRKSFESVLRVISEQPKVGEWIPCSERLPEEDGWYLTTVVYGNAKASGMCKFVNGVWEHSDAGFNDIAWMELPPAYKGE